MEFGILGPLQVVRDGVVLDLGRTQQRVLLARLLVAGGHPVSVDRLADDLWGDYPPDSATLSLQALVSRLRRVLEPDRKAHEPAQVLVTRSPGYALQVPPEDIDAVRFARLTAGGSEALAGGDAVGALRQLDEALALWRGGLLADLADHDFARDAAASYEELRTAALEDRAAALLATGATARALSALETLTRDHPLRERPWELLLTALHSAGRTAEALDRFRKMRASFADELGLDPGPALRALETSLLRGDPPPRPTPVTTAAPVTAITEPTDVPTADAVVGRGRELELIEAAVAQAAAGATRWVVVAGEAGIGKTRLAEHAAATAANHGAHVAWARAHEDGAAPALWPWVQLLRALPTVDDPRDVLRVPAESAEGDMAAGRFERADRVAATMATIPLMPSYEWIGLTLVHARLAADLGEVELGRRLRTALLAHRGHFGHFGTVACSGPVDVQLGRLSSLLGDHDEAIVELTASIETLDRLRLAVWMVRAREALAEALARRSAPGDHERADAVRTEAAAMAKRVGVALEPHVAGVPATAPPVPAAPLP